MKKLFISFALFLVFAVISNNAASQRMFDALPETAKFLPSVVEGIFNLNPGSAVDVKFTQGFHVTGVIKSNKKIQTEKFRRVFKKKQQEHVKKKAGRKNYLFSLRTT